MCGTVSLGITRISFAIAIAVDRAMPGTYMLLFADAVLLLVFFFLTNLFLPSFRVALSAYRHGTLMEEELLRLPFTHILHHGLATSSRRSQVSLVEHRIFNLIVPFAYAQTDESHGSRVFHETAVL